MATEHLFLSYTGALGGAERLLLDLAGGLTEPPALACPPGPLAAAAADAGIVVEPLRPRPLELRGSLTDRAAAPLRLAGQARELAAVLRRREPRVVAAWSMRGLLVASAALRTRRFGGSRPALLFQHNDFLPGPAIAAAVRAAARRADRITCPSRAVAEQLGLGDRTAVIAPGVDLDRFRATAVPGGDAPEVLTLGAIVPWKRPELALDAVAIAARDLPGLRLTLAGATLTEGGGRLAERLRERACEPDLDGRVELPGALADPRPALTRASCLLHCAEREPFGIALVEALASGRPVVAPAAGGPLDIVDASCGVLYEPGSAPAAASALAELLSRPARAAKLGEAGRARAERRFSLDRARAEFRDLLAGL